VIGEKAPLKEVEGEKSNDRRLQAQNEPVGELSLPGKCGQSEPRTRPKQAE
jgi:hypothetical protein